MKYKLLDELVYVHKKREEHEDALSLIIKEIKVFEKAITYCKKYQSDLPDAPNLYLNLFRVVLRHNMKNSNEIPNEALIILNEYSSFLRPNEVFNLLPDTVPLHTIFSYLTNALRYNVIQRNNSSVQNNLEFSTQRSIFIDYFSLRSKRVDQNENTKCVVCNSAIGERKFFAWYPNGNLVHLKCKNENHICPVTTRDFKKNPIIPEPLTQKQDK